MDALTVRLIGRTGKADGIDAAVGDLLIIGSGPDSDLRIDSRTVSRRHAQIARSGDDYFIEDLGSRNGTFLNAQRVRRFRLRNLDVLSLGPDVDLIFVGSGSPTPARLVKTAIVVPARITWIDGPLAGQTEEIEVSGLILGRKGALEGERAISRKHAVISRRADRVTVEDLGSANGTFVNGSPITAVTTLSDGDEINLGGLVRLRMSIGVTAPPAEGPRGESENETILVPSGTLATPILELTACPQETKAFSDQPASPKSSPEPAPHAIGVDDHQPPETILAPAVPIVAPRIEVQALNDASPILSAPTQDETLLAPRGAAIAPPILPRSGPPDRETFRAPQEPPAAPNGLAVRARAARQSNDETTLAPSSALLDLPAARAEDAILTSTNVMVPGDVSGLALQGPIRCVLPLGTFTVGRLEADVVVADGLDVSRQHAKLFVTAAGVDVEDLQTPNGTFVNDTQVIGRSPVPDGSRLRFASVEFAVTYQRGSGEQRS